MTTQDPGELDLPVPPSVREVSSAVLLQGGRVLIIRHGQDRYQLRLTASGKLILTK